MSNYEFKVRNDPTVEYYDLIQRLPDIERTILYLYYSKKIGQGDIAKIIGMTQGAISYKLTRIKERLVYLRELEKVDFNKFFKDVSEIVKDPFDIIVLKCLIKTSCQTETALMLNDKYHLKGKKKLNQIKVKHKIERLNSSLKKLRYKKDYREHYKTIKKIKDNLYMLHEIRYNRFDRRLLMGGKKSEFLNTLASFCKSNKTSDIPLQESYKQFKNFYKHTVTPYAFEKGLETLNKNVIKKLKRKCSTFIKKECPNSYEAFIERYEFITDKFWEEIKAQATPEITLSTHKSKMPKNWDVMLFSEKLEFIKNIKNDDEFKAYATARDPKIKEYFNQQTDSSVELSGAQLSLTGQIIKKIPEADLQKEPKEYYKSKMPLDWLNMNFSEKIDFIQSIGDEGFKAYVLSQDPKIKKYFKHLKEERNKALNLYVTIYSFPADTTTLETKTVVKNLITSLNKLGRGRLQYMEIVDPPLIEIRELR